MHRRPIAVALLAMGVAGSATRAADVRFRTPDEPAFGERIVAAHPSVYEPIRSQARGSWRELLRAGVILLSGCQDNQLAADGAGNGLFTSNLKNVWASGQFSGDHRVFLQAIATAMPPTQTPAYQALGSQVLDFEQQRPFTIGPPVQVYPMCDHASSFPSNPNNGVHAMNTQAIENDNWSDVRNELSRRLPGFQAPVSPDAIYETARAAVVGGAPEVSKDANGRNGKNGGNGTSYLATTPSAAPIVAAPRAATGAPIVRGFWWGFHIECSSQGLRDFIGGASSVNDIAAAIGPVTGPAAPWVTLAAAFISGALGLLQSLDRGNGVYISMSWFALGIFVPTTVPGGRDERGTSRAPGEPYEQAGDPWRRDYTGGAFGTRLEDDIYWNLPDGTVRDEVIVHLNPPGFGNIHFNHWLSNDPTVGHFRLHVGIPMWVAGVVEIRMMIRDAEGRRSTVAVPTQNRPLGPVAVPASEL